MYSGDVCCSLFLHTIRKKGGGGGEIKHLCIVYFTLFCYQLCHGIGNPINYYLIYLLDILFCSLHHHTQTSTLIVVQRDAYLPDMSIRYWSKLGISYCNSILYVRINLFIFAQLNIADLRTHVKGACSSLSSAKSLSIGSHLKRSHFVLSFGENL